MNSPLIAIVGPTASGKSDLAMQIAEQYSGELVCADSRTVYKGMDIGTAKPSIQDQQRVKHHLLDIVEPGQLFTASDFKKAANRAINEIASRGKLPILVGGTGLYVDTILFDYQFGAPADPARRNELEEMDVLELQDVCRENDIVIPENSRNKRHLVRAIELGGLPKRNTNLRSRTIVVGISTTRPVLRDRIRVRAHDMMKAGVVNETAYLAGNYGWKNEAMTGNVYRTLRGVVEGTRAKDEALEELIKRDISLAKRQVTWFKRNPHIIWGTPAELLHVIATFLDVVKR
jgi:tRNA dimethylallyltransferase